MTDEELLANLDDLLRTMPDKKQLHSEKEENQAWLGRSLALLNMWSMARSVLAQGYVNDIQSGRAFDGESGYKKLTVLIQQARHELMVEVGEPTNIVVDKTETFRYFDELRQKIELAKSEILFVDPYLDDTFVSRYLPYVSSNVRVLLLTSKKIEKLVPAAQAYKEQHGTNIQIRTDNGIHDRWIFIDRSEAYQSGASFKDGAKNAPTTLTQLLDAFDAVFAKYDEIWNQATVVEV